MVLSNNVTFGANTAITLLGQSINQTGGGVTQAAGTGSITMNTGAGAITANGTNDFSTLNLTGATAQVNDVNALNLGASTLSGNLVVTGGALTQTGALSVAGTSSFTAGANPITLTQNNSFTGQVTLSNSGANNVTVNNAIPLFLGNALTLGSGTLTLNAAAGITTGVSVTSTGPQIYNGPVSLSNDTTIAGIGVTFANTVNGAKQLNVNDSGATTFAGVVGGTVALTFLGTNAGGTSSSVGVNTTGVTQFGDNTTLSGTYSNAGFTTLGGTTTLAGTATTINAGAGNIALTGFMDGTVAGGQSVILNSSGITTLPTGIGGGNALLGITTDAGGTTRLNGTITTTGTQTYNDAVTVLSNTTINGIGVTFANTVNGTKSLVVNDSGATVFGALVGGQREQRFQRPAKPYRWHHPNQRQKRPHARHAEHQRPDRHFHRRIEPGPRHRGRCPHRQEQQQHRHASGRVDR